MRGSSFCFYALVAAAVIAAADASFLDPLQNGVGSVVGGVVNETLNKGQPVVGGLVNETLNKGDLPVVGGLVNETLHKGDLPIPSPVKDVNQVCTNVQLPPGFPRVQQTFNISAGLFSTASIPFSPKTNYVQQTLNFSVVQPLFNQVAAYSLAQGVQLQSRGEAHITVITPPEFANMQPFVTIDQLNALANTTIQSAEFCIVCIGRDTLQLPVGAATQALNTVYNIVIHAPDIVAYRQKVQDLFISAGGDGSHFDASHVFAPHITLGFTAQNATKGLFNATDLYLEEDIFKFDQSCVAPITLF